jgi:cytochrome c-type biogenesis protein CcmE
MNLKDPKNTFKRILTNRLFIFICLIAALILLSGYYELNYQQHLEHPDTSIIIKNYPIGDTVTVSGNVREVYNNSFILSSTYHQIEVNYTIDSPVNVSSGDSVEVLGVLGNSYHINASKVLVISSFDYLFMIFRSAVIFLIFLYFFRSYWYLDLEKMEFRRLK